MATLADKNQLPGSIIYYDRDWLFPLHAVNNSYFEAKIDAEALWMYADLTISDGYRYIEFLLDLKDETDFGASLGMLDNLTTSISRLREHLVMRREEILAQANTVFGEEGADNE